MARSSVAGRISIAAGIVALAALAGFLAGRETGDSGTSAELAPDRAAIGEPESEMLNRELEVLGTTRTAQLERLRGARTPAEQATASRALARAYEQFANVAARRDSQTGVVPGAESVAEALRRAAAAYLRLAVGAARDNRPTYEAGRRAVRRAEGLVTRRLEASLNPSGAG